MAGPYGITQVDAAGVIGAYEAAQQNRIRQMLLQRQIAKEEREAKTQTGIQSALGRYAGRGRVNATMPPEGSVPGYGGGMLGGYGRGSTERWDAPETAPSGALGAVEAYGTTPAASPLPSAMSRPAAPRPTAADREQLFSELLALDAQVAGQVMDAFSKMDKAQVEAASQRNTILARGAQHLLSIPREQRAAELQRIAPALMEQGGITPEQLQGFDPTDDNALSFIVGQARDIEKIIESSQPKIQSVTQGGSVLSIDPRTGKARTIYESPTIEGPGGDVYARPPEMSTMRPSETNLRAQAEEAIRMGADPAAVNKRLEEMLQGGASQPGSQTFP